MKKNILVLVMILFCGSVLFAQGKIGIGITGSYFSPTGDFADVYKDGFGGNASLTYNLNQSLQVSAAIGYSQFSFNNDKFNELLAGFFSAFGSSTKVDVQSKLKIIPLMLGGRYYLTNSNFRPYAAVDLGLHIITVDASSIKIAGQTFDAVASQSKTATAWGLGAGFLINVAPKISLDVNGKINGNNLEVGTDMSVSTSGASVSTSSKSTMTFFSVSAGLLFEL